MAKTAKMKKKPQAPHSRAARRAASPSINIDKSLKDLPLPEPSKPTAKPHVLAASSSGISKKTKNKPQKRQQRLRQLKGMERAADVLDKMEVKVQKSWGKEKNVRERRKAWEEVNGGRGRKGEANAFEALAEKEDREWISDEEMEGDEAAAGAVPEADVSVVGGAVQEVVVPASIPLPAENAEEAL